MGVDLPLLLAAGKGISVAVSAGLDLPDSGCWRIFVNFEQLDENT